ncbi:MAG: septum formation initiator family protein [Tessaracoccus sp.]|uniref:FtsB family cell division protein n=1 Tax=Tessaracoccus sp. TaxID=1971211 RepID=UPI001EC099C6|nr:septum formation initiator family protein [Tessaracoccus sp.]MBK7819719.1 septum formation initiator family protein [Tessaracoccus sp.]
MQQLDAVDVNEAMSAKKTPAPRTQRAVTATWRLVVLLAVIAGIAMVLAHSLRVYFTQAEEISVVKAEIAAEQDKIADLNDKLERWNDPAYVRSVARSRLGWVLPGEVGYRVLDAEGNPLVGAAIQLDAAEPPQLWWEKMWGSVQVADSPAEEEASEDPKATEPPRTIELSPSPKPEKDG